MMNNETLSLIHCGDTISIEGVAGEVVFSSITDSYSREFPKADWNASEYDGIMIKQENGALVFHDTEFLKNECSRLEKL